MARGARVSTREASLPGPYRILASQVCMSLLRKAISERMLSSPNPTNVLAVQVRSEREDPL